MHSDIYTTASYDANYAFLPIIIGVGVGLAMFTAVFMIINNSDSSKETTKISGTSLGILGMQEAGKTQLLRTLQNKPYSKRDEGTSTDDYAPFDITINGRQYKFQAGKDIGGDELYITPFYKQFIKDKDAVFFIFDVHRYLDDSEYAKNVKIRLSLVYRHLKKKHNNQSISGKYLIIGSHMDELTSSQQKKTVKDVQASVAGKDYAALLLNNLLMCDLRNREELLENLIKRKIL